MKIIVLYLTDANEIEANKKTTLMLLAKNINVNYFEIKF